MSPLHFLGGYAGVFIVNSYGYLGGNDVNGAYGLRPVINLKANTDFKLEGSGTPGTIDNPYIVK